MGSGLFLDFYSLTMAQGFFQKKLHQKGIFEMFFRRSPFDGGFAVFAGLETLLDHLTSLRFSEQEIVYLRERGIFREDFLEYLASFSFSGDLLSMEEGTIVFPHEPLLVVEAPLLEAQIIESSLLNILNYQSLIATKSARIKHATGEKKTGLLEFGLRRAPGPDGAFSGTRAAYIGGGDATSNTLAAQKMKIPVRGTMSHSWVMSFDSELEAFRAYAEIYPDFPIFLIDTYDTLRSGLESVVKVAKEREAQGLPRFGVRIDSGDLQYLSEAVKRRFEKEGLREAVIAVSNDLNEQIITQLVSQKAPIDLWGVGTEMITGGKESSLTGVYKMVACETHSSKMTPAIKISNHPEKITNPGAKQVYRFFNKERKAVADLMTLRDEKIDFTKDQRLHHPHYEYEGVVLAASEFDVVEPLLKLTMRNGKRLKKGPSLPEIRDRVQVNLATLDPTLKRLINPHTYKVSLSPMLKELKFRLIREKNPTPI